MKDNRPLIFGLGHYSRTGKDTFASALTEGLRLFAPELRVARKSFAGKLKDVCHQLYGWAGLMDEAYYSDPEVEHERDEVLPAIGKTPVELWVDFGTKAVRGKVWESTWVDYLMKTDFGLDLIVIPDVRFFNEAEAIKKAGGCLIKVVRPGYGPRMTVADLSLVYYDGWDNVIGRRGLADLYYWAGRYACRVQLGEDPRAIRLDAQEVQAGLAIEKLPSRAEVVRVFEEAGMEFDECNIPPGGACGRDGEKRNTSSLAARD